MLKILSIIGARPQIIKAAAFSRAVIAQKSSEAAEIILHTGQHYDERMSAVFFEEMKIPRPDYNLNVGSGSHGRMTGIMLSGIEEIILKEQPGCVVVYGDTNSTLAGAIAASKLHIPVVHIEAGMRSFNKTMPEEINRILTDHASTLLFTPSKAGYQNLMREGFSPGNPPPFTIDNPKIFLCGDVMFDNSVYFAPFARAKTNILTENGLTPGKFVLVTIHRDYNTDNAERLTNIFRALIEIAKSRSMDIVLPLHPRTQKMIGTQLSSSIQRELNENKRIKIIPPATYLEMISLETNAFLIMTDSGGVQKEAFYYRKPCITLRSETEWVELVENGNNIIGDADPVKILAGYEKFSNNPKLTYPSFYGDGKAAEFILSEIVKNFSGE